MPLSLTIERDASSAMRPSHRALAHIPGEDGWPVIGRTFELLAEPQGFVEYMAARYGPVYRTRALGDISISLLGPEANELVLLDPNKIFSSSLGWSVLLDRLFPRGLMLLDFDEHRLHRRALSVAFKAGPMRSYLEQLNAGIAAGIAEWPHGREMLFYPALKKLTLDLAATSFLGVKLGPDVEALKQAFTAMVAASIAVIRVPLPGTKMGQGVKSRAFVIDYFKRLIPLRRESGGDDLFSHLCRATHEDGSLLTAQDIADHMSFLMMAAHDTLTSSLTSFVYRLAVHPEWQASLRDEIAGQNTMAGEPLLFERLEKLQLTEMAFKEAMRMTPPVPSIPRRAIRDFVFKGFKIPAFSAVNINPLYTHYMPDVWPDPERYDPMRFSEAACRERHKFAFVPFGGGAHMCLGLHFAYMQAKCFTWHFLRRFQVSIEERYRPAWRMWPIPQPRDGLRVTLTPF
jgi:cytochrome P450